MYVEFGATRACFVTKQCQEPIKQKIRNLEHRNREKNSICLIKCSNIYVTSRDYNPIFDIILILQATFDMIGFRAFYLVLERLF